MLIPSRDTLPTPAEQAPFSYTTGQLVALWLSLGWSGSFETPVRSLNQLWY